jgi:hypothetical protein
MIMARRWTSMLEHFTGRPEGASDDKDADGDALNVLAVHFDRVREFKS